MAYIDTNMVRAGVVSHPSMWPFCGYNEIQEPRRKNVLINYERLQGLFGAGSYDKLRKSHEGWVEEYLEERAKTRQDEWTRSIAVGNKPFVENVKALLGFGPKGEKSWKAIKDISYGRNPFLIKLFSGVENDDIGPENTYFWDIKPE